MSRCITDLKIQQNRQLMQATAVALIIELAISMDNGISCNNLHIYHSGTTCRKLIPADLLPLTIGHCNK